MLSLFVRNGFNSEIMILYDIFSFTANKGVKNITLLKETGYKPDLREAKYETKKWFKQQNKL